MSSLLRTLVVLHLLLLLISPSNATIVVAKHPPSPPSIINKIKSECIDSETKYYNLCVKSLRSDPRTSNADPKLFPGLFPNISMDISLAKAIVVHSDINNILKDKKSSTINLVTKQCLETCLNCYENAIHSTQNAIGKFRVGITGPDALLILHALGDSKRNITYCEDGCSKGPREDKRILRKIEISRQLSVIAVDLLKLSQL